VGVVSERLVLIGDFSARTRLSPKALRRYDELGLLVPVRVDPDTGYRWYSPDQVERARVVALLRHLDMPLARVAEVLDLVSDEAVAAIRAYWAEVEGAVTTRTSTVAYLCQLLTRGDRPMTNTYDVDIRPVSERALLSAVRYVHGSEAGQVAGGLLMRMRGAGPGPEGVAGCPFLIFHGEVSDDSDGPMEVVRPIVDLTVAQAAATQLGDVQARREPAHDEAFVRLTLPQARWPAQLAALDALKAHVLGLGREPSGPPRQVMIADWRTVGDDEPACDLAVPLA
jgi:DNA-binding transcriptional MerR regulator